jgi:hypothetical protein
MDGEGGVSPAGPLAACLAASPMVTRKPLASPRPGYIGCWIEGRRKETGPSLRRLPGAVNTSWLRRQPIGNVDIVENDTHIGQCRSSPPAVRRASFRSLGVYL